MSRTSQAGVLPDDIGGQDVRQDAMSQVEAQLTPEQLEKFRKAKEERKAKRQEYKKKHGKGKGHHKDKHDKDNHHD